MNNKKMEKASATAAAASVSTASVVATRTLASSTPITSTNKVATIKGIPAGNNPKSHPKTLDIPNAKKTTQISIPLTNGTTAASIKGDKKTAAPPAPSQQFARSTGISNKVVSDASRRTVCNVDGGTDSISREKQKFQPPLQQQNVSPSSSSSMSSSTSPSSSSSSSGIQPAQIASICREVAQVREEHISIRKSLSEREGELGKTRVALRNIAQERDLLRNKVSELEHMLKRSPEMYSHVAAILSNTNNTLHGGFQTSPTQSLSSAKHSPEEISAHKVIPQASLEKSKITEMKNSSIVSSPTRNMVIQHQQQQNQKLSALPSSETTFTSRPDIVPPPPSQMGTMDSPRKCNGNGGNLTKIGSSLSGDGGTTNETQKISGNGGGKNGDGAGGNFIPCLPPQPSSPNISNNINSQESHQASHNNKNLQQKQHSMQQSNYNVNNMKHTTTKSTFFTALPDKNNKSIYYGHEHEARASPTPQPSLSLQYLEYHNGNSRNVNGNDMPAMTNSNNNNNHRKSTSAGGGGRGGVGQYVYDYHHQNQRHLSQSGITGLDLMLLGPDCSTKVVEHLVHPVAIESSVREIQHTLVMRGAPLNGDRVREVEIEIDRLNSRIDHLRSQNDVLTLNLDDAKSHAERLTVLLGKYESNNVALQLALRYSDQMGDTYEVLSALLETELAQVVTRIHAAGQLQLICNPPSPTTPNSANATSSGAVAVTPRAVLTSSGNNNNSNDNSPSEHVPPPTSSQAETAAGKNGSNNNIAIINGNNEEKKDNNDPDNHTEKVEGERQNKLNDNDNAAVITSSPVAESAELVMVPVKNRNGPHKIISPTSPSTTVQSPSSSKVMHLVEQARRNRLAAEQAARFLLSKFTSSSLHSSPYQHGGVVIPPTGSLNNSNGLGGGGGDSRGSFFVRPTCQSNSTTSINSVTSNLSNMSGERSLSLSSPSVDGDGEEKVGDSAMKYQLQKKQEEQEQTSATITSGCRGAQDGGGMEVAPISQENIKKGSAGVSDTSPTTSYTNTFRPPFNPNGNRQENGCTNIITSLLPLLRNAAAQQKNHHTNNGPTSSPEDVSAAIEPAIRHLISTLKAERDAVKQTVMELESESLESLTPSPKPSSPYYGNGHSHNNNNSSSSNATPTAPWSPAEARKLDLETAVLMQELMAMKEERAELRAQLFLIEKEKDSLELRLRSHESQEEAYRARINYLKSEIMDCKSLHSAATTTTMVTTTLDTYQQHQNRNRNEIVNSQQQQQQLQKNNGSNRNLETIINNNNNNNQNVNWEREALLKKRIHELAGTLEKVTIGSQIREKQNQEMINELNRANGILMQTLDVAKKKYQNRIKKMEDQVMYISERHASQLKLFGGERMPTVGSKFHA